VVQAGQGRAVGISTAVLSYLVSCLGAVLPQSQAYTLAPVAPEERTAAASVTSLASSAGSATSPVVGGARLQGSLLVLGLPFEVAGALKATSDLTLGGVFRRVDSAGVREGTGRGECPS
jgi:predicted MFS family arabinose efflux permease